MLKRVSPCHHLAPYTGLNVDSIADNDKPIYRNKRYKPQSYKDLLDLSFWAHVRPFIQKHGRVQTYKEPKVDEEEAGEENEEVS